MAIGDIYQLVVSADLQGQNTENVFHFKVTTDDTTAALEAAVGGWATGIYFPAVTLIQTNALTWNYIKAQKIWPLPVLIGTVSYPATPGTIDRDSLPSEVALVLTKQSIFAGPAGRGRSYVAGLATDAYEQTTGLWKVATVTSAQNVANVLSQEAVGIPGPGRLQPVIYNRVTHETKNVSSGLARGVPRSQRRRQIGRGY